jgi:RNA polymerase sigma factor for flagellar operon FliA
MPKARKKLSHDETDALIEKYAPLVRSIAQTLLRRLPPSVEFDDLLQDGYIGLLGALLHSTRTNADGQYRHYLAQRVRGAMLDGLRENDPASRRVRKMMRDVEEAIRKLSHEKGELPGEGEVAKAMGLSLQDYQHMLQEAHGYTLLSLEDFGEASTDERDFLEWCAHTNSDPFAALQRSALQRSLLVAISELSEREDMVMASYYVEGLTMRGIAEKLGLTEGRISQIHTQAIAKLRATVMQPSEKGATLLSPRWRSA